MVDLPSNIPPRIAKLPRDSRGFPVPRFVQWFGGEPDFRVIRPGYMAECIGRKVCWVCGERLGRMMCFVVGPMVTLNKLSGEPPCHYECAEFAVRVCPFLTKPRMRRNEKDMPEHTANEGMKLYNPGASVIWVTKSYNWWPDPQAGFNFAVGAPERVEWWAQGREATHDEAVAALAKSTEAFIEESRMRNMPVLDSTLQRAQELLP